MALQQAPCGHLVPAGAVRCPTCGAMVIATGPAGSPGSAPRRPKQRHPVVTALLIGLGVMVGIVALGAVAALVTFARDPQAARDKADGTRTSTEVTGRQTVRSGRGKVTGPMVPLRTLGLKEPTNVISVLPGKVLEVGPEADIRRVRVEVPGAGASFGGFEAGKAGPVKQIAPEDWDPCALHRWEWEATSSTRAYFEKAEYCDGIEGITPNQFMAMWGRYDGKGAIVDRTVDGHPAARMAMTLARGEGHYRIWTGEAIKLDKGWLVIYAGFPLVKNGGGPDLSGLERSVQIQ